MPDALLTHLEYLLMMKDTSTISTFDTWNSKSKSTSTQVKQKKVLENNGRKD